MKRSNLRSRFITASAFLFFILPIQARAVWDGKEGDMWLKWRVETRNAYVYAYTSGIVRGFMDGCDAGTDYLSSKQKHKTDEMQEFLDGCNKFGPVKVAEVDDVAIMRSVTGFYRAYPEQRSVYIYKVILRLLAGRTVEQIHTEFPQGDGERRQ